MKIFVLVAAVAMALASCQKPEIENVQPQEYEYTFLIGNADTKATVGETCVEWEAGDQMGVYTISTSGTSYNRWGNITPGSPAKMVVSSFYALSVGDKVYAYYPYVSSNSQDAANVNLEISAIQDGVDDMPMVSIPFAIPTDLEAKTDKELNAGEIKFANLGSVIEFNVYTETDAYAAEVVKSVTFEADKALAGAFTFDLTKVNYSDESTLSISDLTETTVVANASDLAVGTKDAPAVVKMVVAPGTYAGNIIVKTDAATYTFPISIAKEFKRSVVKPLGLKLRDDVREENTSKEVTISFATTDQRVSQDENQQKWSNEGVVFINDKTSESTAVVSNVNPVRLYKNSTITISAPGNISKIEFICNNAEYATALNSSIEGSSMSTTVVTVEASSNSVTYTLSGGQVRLNSITVTYTPTGEDVTLIPELSVTTSEVEVAAAGGNAEIEYKVFNPKDGVSVVASANVDWISEFTDSDGKIGFAVEENPTEQSREAEVTLAYEGAESVSVTITQAAKAAEGAAYYEKVTSEPTDWGGKYLLVCETKSMVLSAISTTSTKYGIGTTIEISDSKILKDAELEACEITIESSNPQVLAFKGSYLTWTSGNSLNVATAISDNTKWNISFDSGNAKIANVKDNTRKIVWNASSPRFACYTTDQTAVQLYKLVGDSSGEGTETPVEKTLESIAVSGAKTEYTVGNEFVKPTVTATYSDGSTEDVTASAEFTGYNMSAADTYTVTVSYSGKTTTYYITVSAAQGGGEDGGETTGGYTLVTSLSDITTGQYVIAAKVDGTYYAMSNTFASKIDGANVTVTDNTISESDAQSYVVSITKDGANYYISSDTNYLTYSSSTNLGTQSSQYSWTIAAGTNGTFRINATTGTNRAIMYQISGARFGGYSTTNTSGYADIELFKKN